MRNAINCNRGRRGSVLIYTLFLMTVVMAVVSLGMDYAHCQAVKTECQRAAELCARDYLEIYLKYGAATATTPVYMAYVQQQNAVDGKYAAATYVVTPGTWNTSTGTFTATSWASTVTAVQVRVSKTAANNNGVQVLFGAVLGRRTVDVQSTAVAALVGGQSGNVTVPSTSSPYLAGMPNGSTTAGWGDNTSNSTPYQVSSIPVVPGTYITMTNTGGQSSIYYPTIPKSGPDGNASLTLHHGENYNHSPNPAFPNPENGIGDAKMPADALMGVFLTDDAPDTNPAPPAVDWTDADHKDKPTYSDIRNQQPFMIGNGTTTDGTVQQFLVPAGATRLYLGTWDGVMFNNNTGSVTGTLAVRQKIMLVQVN